MRDELLRIMTGGSPIGAMPGCRLYVVAVDPDDPDGIWVTEIWESEEAHAASLQREEVRERISHAMSLMDRTGIRQQRLDARAGIPAPN